MSSKVMVSLPGHLLRQIDDAAARRGMSRSGFLAAAAARELEHEEPATLAAAVARSRERFRRAGSFEAADVIRAARDSAR
jgi:hypothetical protein